MNQEDPINSEKLPTIKRIALRLDNGSVIRCSPGTGSEDDSKVAVLHYREGFEKGIITNADVERMGGYLGHLEARIAQINRQRKSDTAAVKVQNTKGNYTGCPPNKRQRTQNITKQDLPVWSEKALTILNRLGKRKDSYVFALPVVVTEEIKDYPLIVEKPMDLRTVSHKLRSNKYASPHEWAADVELIWNNCLLYNPAGSAYATAAARMKSAWNEHWRKSGLGADGTTVSGRSKRPGSGQAAGRVSEQPLHSGGRSKGGGRSKALSPHKSAGTGYPQRQQQPSHEAPPRAEEVQPQQDPPSLEMSGEHKRVLAIALEELAVSEEVMEGIVVLLGEGNNNSEEVEIDIDTIPELTLWQLDAYLREVSGGQYNPGVPPRHGAVVTDPDSDEETDEEL